MKKMALSAFLILASGAASSAPFLTADPACYDPSGADSSCPTGYEYSSDSGASWIELGAEVTDTSIVIWEDVGGAPNGPNSWVIRAFNSWGESEQVPFDFTAGVPVGPGGLRLVAPPAES